ncbi:KICSTOR subunit 2-like [Babylonia areolata]|uniref:KICSTOR subunit 2-like n=1 Tax=Babylonia areolata TaxID=304850 RepID=UPI003FCFE016
MSAKNTMTSVPAVASPVGPREESFLETFFAILGQLSFDKAKEMMEREKEAHKAFTAASWGTLVQCLAQLVTAERMYLSLTFLEQKRFQSIGRSKENLRTTYTLLMQEFRRMEDATPQTRDVTHSHALCPFPSATSSSDFDVLLAHLCGQLCHYLSVRQKMMDFYEQISMMGAHKNMNFEDLSTMVSDITLPYSTAFHHPILSPLKTLFSWESDILGHLLQAQILMGEWQFLPSLLQLHAAHSKLLSWLSSAAVKESKKTFGSGSKLSAMPALFHWLTKFKGVLVSKFSVYFHTTLSKQSTPSDMKNWLTKAPEDYFSRIVAFHRRCDPFNISLVLDTHGLSQPFMGHGYHHPQRPASTPQGMDSYPAILSYPGDQPIQHWPNVLMLVTQRLPRTSASSAFKTNYFYDPKVQSTYFITKIDPRVSLVVIFECKKSEKDSHTNSFLTDFSAQLRSQWILGNLRPNSR